MRKHVIVNHRYPHAIKIVRKATKVVEVETPTPSDEDDEDPFSTGSSDSTTTKATKEVDEVLYEGRGRAYTDTTVTGTGDVDINRRKASIPMRFDKWEEGKKPLDGDTLYATVGNNTEIWRVNDCEPDNDRSVLYCEFVRV